MSVIYIDDKKVPLIHGAGGGCFSASTQIKCESSYKPISDIQIGDKVWAFDDYNQPVLSFVTETFYHPTDKIYRITHEHGYLDITLNHWVLTPSGEYQEMREFYVGDYIVLGTDEVSKILSMRFLEEAPVYNFKVQSHHCYIANNVKVHNGGGAGKGAGTEDPNNLFSTDILFMTIGLGEGPVYRINPNGPIDIEFNESPVDDLLTPAGKLDTEKFFSLSNTGTITQQKLPLFGDYTFVPQRLASPVELKKGNIDGVPRATVEKQTTSATALTAIKFYFVIGSLLSQTDDGDITGHSLKVKVTVFDSTGTQEIAAHEREVSGKTSVGYSFDIFISIPQDKVSASGYKFTVEKTSNDSRTAAKRDNVSIYGWTEIVEQPIAYTRTATIGYGIKATSQYKGTVPAISNMVKGLLVKVPSNYNQPILENGDIDWRQVEVSDSDRQTYGYYQQKTGMTLLTSQNPTIYEGIWDGQFVYSWTQNPVWVIYDILTNKSYGLGIPKENIDKFSFYNAAVYNDACDVNGQFIGVSAQADGTYRYKPRTLYSTVAESLVGLPQGTSIKERRFIIDTVISDQKQIMDIISLISITFRAILYYKAGKLFLYQDRPDELPSAIFNETNIIKDSFIISGIQEDSLITGVDISYLDATNHYKRDVLRIDDQKALSERNGIENIIKVDLEGVTRKSQAIRMAQYLIADNKYSRRLVGFKTGIEASEIPPGAIISISQRAASVAWGYGGIVATNSQTSNTSVLFEHIGVPGISSSVFTSNTNPLAIRIASTYSGQVDTYIISDSQYELITTSNVSSGYDLVRVYATKKFNPKTKQFEAFSGAWGDNHLPRRHDLWSLGEINNPSDIYTSLTDKLFKVINTKREADETVLIEAKEYISNVYVDSDTLINYEPLAFGDLYSPLQPPPSPNFTLSTFPKRAQDGSVYTDIEISTFTDISGYSNELKTEFFRSKPDSLSIIKQTEFEYPGILKITLDSVEGITDGDGAVLLNKNGFTTDVARTKVLVTNMSVVDIDPVAKENGNISFSVAGFGEIKDLNYGDNIHLLDVNNTFYGDGTKGLDKVSVPISQQSQGGTGDAEGLLGFIGVGTGIVNYSANVAGFNTSTNTVKVDNDFSGTKTLFSLLPTPPFYIYIPQLVDHTQFSNNSLYITGSHLETVYSNVITLDNIVESNKFKQPLAIANVLSNFVSVFINNRTYTDFTLETGPDNLANSQVSIQLSTLPTEDADFIVTVKANVYTPPAIEIGDRISWNAGNTYTVANTSYDTSSPSYNAYLTANSIFRIGLEEPIKSNDIIGYAINVTPDPIGKIGNVNLSTNTFTFEYNTEIFPESISQGNSYVYSINAPSTPFESISFGEASTRTISRAETGIHVVKARNINKYGRKSPFVTKIVNVRDIPISEVNNLVVSSELYKDTTLGVSTRILISFDHILGQEVTDYEISYKVTASASADLEAYNTVKVSASGIDSDNKIRVKIDNVEKGGEIIVRVTPLNKTIRGATKAIRTTIVGKEDKPQNVENFVVGQVGDSLLFVWSYPSDIDIDLLEIQIKQIDGTVTDFSDDNLNSLWPIATEVATIDAQTNRVLIDIAQFGTYTYLIKTKDTSGNFSESAVAAVYTSTPQSYATVLKAYSEDDPSGTYLVGYTNDNSTENIFPSFSNSIYGGLSYPGADPVDNANGTSSGWSVYSIPSKDLIASGNAFYQTQLRDVGAVVTGSIQYQINAYPVLSSTWLDFSEQIGDDQVTEASTSGKLKDVDFSGSLGIGNILGFDNASAATVSYDTENKTLVSGFQSGFPANVYAIVALGNFDGDVSNANVFSLIAGTEDGDTVVLGSSWYSNGVSTGSNGYSNLAVAGTSYKLVNLKQWIDLSSSDTFAGAAGIVSSNLQVRYTSVEDPYHANGNVDLSVFSTEGFESFVAGPRTFRHFQLRYNVNNSDPTQAQFILDKFRYRVGLQERPYSQTVTVTANPTTVDYSRMNYAQTPRVTGASVISSADQTGTGLPQVVVTDKGIANANIAVYFANGDSASSQSPQPVVDFTISGV